MCVWGGGTDGYTSTSLTLVVVGPSQEGAFWEGVAFAYLLTVEVGVTHWEGLVWRVSLLHHSQKRDWWVWL